ncbi:MAG: hypothetical protein JW937_05005 [Candidatus Omnitrophica bacterium]|nr:hypothetical protein [Candidatus Omnitrophota bacterium]
MPKRSGLNSQSGFATIIAVFVMMLFSAMGMVLVSISAGQLEGARSNYREAQALYVADSGYERAKQLLAEDPSWTPGGGVLTETFTISGTTGSYDITVNTVGANIEVTIESSMLGA